jgi:hypothetical protein
MTWHHLERRANLVLAVNGFSLSLHCFLLQQRVDEKLRKKIEA